MPIEIRKRRLRREHDESGEVNGDIATSSSGHIDDITEDVTDREETNVDKTTSSSLVNLILNSRGLSDIKGTENESVSRDFTSTEASVRTSSSASASSIAESSSTSVESSSPVSTSNESTPGDISQQLSAQLDALFSEASDEASDSIATNINDLQSDVISNSNVSEVISHDDSKTDDYLQERDSPKSRNKHVTAQERSPAIPPKSGQLPGEESVQQPDPPQQLDQQPQQLVEAVKEVMQADKHSKTEPSLYLNPESFNTTSLSQNNGTIPHTDILLPHNNSSVPHSNSSIPHTHTSKIHTETNLPQSDTLVPQPDDNPLSYLYEDSDYDYSYYDNLIDFGNDKEEYKTEGDRLAKMLDQTLQQNILPDEEYYQYNYEDGNIKIPFNYSGLQSRGLTVVPRAWDAKVAFLEQVGMRLYMVVPAMAGGLLLGLIAWFCTIFIIRSWGIMKVKVFGGAGKEEYKLEKIDKSCLPVRGEDVRNSDFRRKRGGGSDGHMTSFVECSASGASLAHRRTLSAVPSSTDCYLAEPEPDYAYDNSAFTDTEHEHSHQVYNTDLEASQTQLQENSMIDEIRSVESLKSCSSSSGIGNSEKESLNSSVSKTSVDEKSGVEGLTRTCSLRNTTNLNNVTIQPNSTDGATRRNSD